MPIVADATVAIRGDLKPWRNDLKRAEAEAGGFGAKIQAALSPKNILKAGAVFGIGTTLPSLVSNAIGYLDQASEKFSALQQSTQTIDQIFGDSAAVIEDWAERASSAAGLSRQAVFDSGSVIGQTLINMGVDATTAADLVVQLQQRAADLATAFGRPVGDAITGIGALLRGEYDTIEKFGVSIKQVDVNSRIAALGLDTSTDSARRQAQALATLDLFLNQTADSSGRFDDAQGQVSNVMAQAQADMDNFDADVGQSVASIKVGAVKVGRFVGDIVNSVATGIANIGDLAFDPRVQDLADQLGITFNEAQDVVSAAMADSKQSFDATVDALLSSAYENQAAAFNAYAAVSSAAVEGLGSQQTSLEQMAEAMAKIPISAIEDKWADTRRAAFQTTIEHSKGILDGQNQVKVAWEVLTQLQEEEQTRAQRISYLNGLLSSEELRDGLNDGRPGVRSAASALRAQIIAELASLGVDAYRYGQNVGSELAAGMYTRVPTVRDSAYAIGGAIRAGVGINSEPEDPNSPLRGITKWGGNIVKTIAAGIYGELGTGSAASAALAGALVPSMSIGSGVVAGGIGSGGTVNYNLTVNGVPHQVSSVEEMVDKLMDLGVMSEGRLS